METNPKKCECSGTLRNPCATINETSVNNNGLKTNNLVPPPGDGGFPPPTTTACSVQAPPCYIVDPCDQKADINTRAANSVIANLNSQILSKTTATGNEYGVTQNITTLNGNTYINSAVTTQGLASQWKPTFSWDSTSGYTVGFSHGHPGGTGPSPEDVYVLFGQINLNSVLRNNTPNKQTYEAMASVTTMTLNGTYVVTINNWNEMNTILTNSYSTKQLQDNFANKYIALSLLYLTNNTTSNSGDAGTYALMQLFPGVINVYYAPVGSNSYAPLIVKTVSGVDKLAQTPCP